MSSSGLTLPQLTATAADFADITGNIGDSSQLATPLQNSVIVSMSNASYQMSDSEAATSVKVLSATGNKNTLTWPSTADTKCTSNQIVSNAFGQETILSSQTGGNTATIMAGCVSEVAFIPGVSMIVLANEYAKTSNKVSCGVISNTGDYVISYTDAGSLLVGSDAGAVNYTIGPDMTNMPNNARFQVMQKGAGSITFVAGIGVNLYGITTTVGHTIYTIYRDDGTNDWYIG